MGDISNKTVENLVRQAGLQTLEKAQKLKEKEQKLSISIPKEITYQEKRVPLTPLSVQLLVNRGHQVILESGSGQLSNFTDLEYSNAGAQVVYDHESAFSGQIVLKIDPPTMKEMELLKPGQILLSAMQMAGVTKEYIECLQRRKITAVGYEFMRDENGALPIVRAMSEIAGRASVLIASEYLNNAQNGKGELIGGIPGVQPTEMVIIGAGAVGEYAARAALGLGANVKLFDNSIAKLRRIELNLGKRVASSTILPHTLGTALANCDVAIGALRSKDGRSPCVVTEEMVQRMKPKSLIIDVSIDQGGCFETSEVTNHENPVVEKYDILHYGVPNMTSNYSRTASYAFSNILTPICLDIAEQGGFYDYLWASESFRKGVYIFKGHLTHGTIQ